MPMKLLFDFDDVLADSSNVWFAELNRQHNTSATWNETRDYDLRLSFPDVEPREIYRPYLDGTVYLDAHPIKEAQSLLPELEAEGYEIYVCTSNLFGIDHPILIENLMDLGMTRSVDYLIQFLGEYFPSIRTDHIIITADKSIICGDALIDDNPAHLTRFPGLRILMDKPWNVGFDTERHNILRAHTYRDVARYIREEL